MSISSINRTVQNLYVANNTPTSANTTIKAKTEIQATDSAVASTNSPVVLDMTKLSGNVNASIMSIFRQRLEDAFDPNKQNQIESPQSKAFGEFMGSLFKAASINVYAASKEGKVYVPDFSSKMSELSQAISNEVTDTAVSSENDSTKTDNSSTTTSSPYAAIEQSYKNLVSVLGGSYNKVELSNFLESFGKSFNITTVKGNVVDASA